MEHPLRAPLPGRVAVTPLPAVLRAPAGHRSGTS